jgi:OFA family oxalate/formate antiporter-like MFS transporter
MSGTSSNRRGWTVTSAAVGINLVLGVLYAWSVIGKELVKASHWTRTDAAEPFAVATAAFAVTMIFAGRAQDKLGPRPVAMLGGLLLGLGMVGASLGHSPLAMMLTFGVLGGMGIGLGYSATTPPCIKWFPPARKGLITGLVVSGIGLASVWMAPFTTSLVHRVGLAHAFLVLGGATIVMVCTLAQFLKNPPAGFQPVATVESQISNLKSQTPPRRDLDWPQMLGTPAFYLLWVTFILAAVPGLLLIANMATIAGEQAHDKTVAFGSLTVMVLAIFNTSGRVVGGWVSDRIGRRNTMVLAFLLQALNMLLFRYYTGPALLLFGVAFAGVCYGTIFTLFPAASADFYGVRHLGVNYGLLFTAFGVAGVTGSLLGGRVCDLTKSFTVAYLICAGTLVVAAVLAAITRAPSLPPAENPGGAQTAPSGARCASHARG